MHSHSKIISLFLAVALAFSCAKEREEEFSQGMGKDLLSISEYQGKVFSLETTGQLLGAQGLTAAQELSVDASASDLDAQQLVTYKSTSPLMEDIPFRGQIGKKYEIRYEVTDDRLVVLKVATKEELPFNELTYAKELSDGLMGVPLFSHPVSLVRVENVKDGNNDKTHKLAEFSARSVSEATHFRVDLSTRQDFDAVTKIDVFPGEYFAGEWFYAATIVSASTKKANIVGRDVSIDFEAESVSRIKFEKTPVSLRAVNTNIDATIDTTDAINLQSALEIPVQWVDYKVKSVNGKRQFKEEELGDNNRDSRDWKLRDFAKADFKLTETSLTKSTKATLEKLEIASDYLSFTIHYIDEEIRIKYSLRRAHKPIAGRVYKKDDRRLFGIFATYRNFIENYRFHRDGDYERQVLMNRFYPAQNSAGKRQIVYHFSHGSSPEFREISRQAIQSWNKAFEEANTGIEILLDETKTVALGDLRYNIINIMDTKDGASLLGYGPSIVDSESGEIISATTNIYVNPFREGLVSTIRNYVQYKLGLYETSQIGILAPSNRPDANDSLRKIHQTLQNQATERGTRLDDHGQDIIANILKKMDDSNKKWVEKNGQAKTHVWDRQQSHHCQFETTRTDAIKRIELACNKELSAYIDELKEDGVSYNSREISVLEDCANKLVHTDILATLVHEMGHNLGLRHNFAASSDPKNFQLNDKGEPLAKTSSVMDYSSANVDELVAPGTYDIEAIRFAYAGAIKKDDNSVLKLDTTKSINENLSSKNLNRRNYRFCTDEDVGETDPLCNRYDYGTTPTEVVQSYIDQFNAYYTIYGHRYDRARAPSELAFILNAISRYLIPVKGFYDQWRFHLAQFVGKRNQYLEGLDRSKYLQAIKAMSEDNGVHGEHYHQYFPAAMKSYAFFKNLVSMPAKYCLAKAQDNSVRIEAIDFEKLQGQVYKTKGVTINECSHPLAILEIEQSGFTFIRSVGQHLSSRSITLDIESEDYGRNQIVGLGDVKEFAMQMISMRRAQFKQHAVENFAPNFLDNPIMKEEIEGILVERAMDGITSRNLDVKDLGDFKIPRFETEKSFLPAAYALFVRGTSVPGRIEYSLSRMRPYRTIKTGDPSEVPEGAATTVFANTIIAATPSSKVAHALIQKREALKASKTVAEQGLKLLDIDQFKALLKQLPVPTRAELKAMTLGQYLNNLARLDQITQRAQGEIKTHLTALFQLEAQLLSIARNNQEALKDHMESPALKVLTEVFELPEEMTKLSKEDLDARADQYMVELGEAIAKAREFASNIDEYEAQIDIITEMLLTL